MRIPIVLALLLSALACAPNPRKFKRTTVVGHTALDVEQNAKDVRAFVEAIEDGRIELGTSNGWPERFIVESLAMPINGKTCRLDWESVNAIEASNNSITLIHYSGDQMSVSPSGDGWAFSYAINDPVKNQDAQQTWWK